MINNILGGTFYSSNTLDRTLSFEYFLNYYNIIHKAGYYHEIRIITTKRKGCNLFFDPATKEKCQ